MEETLSLPVNMPFDKRAVCTKSGHEPDNVGIYTSRVNRKAEASTSNCLAFVVLPDPGSPTRRYNIAGSFIPALWHILTGL